MTIPAEPVEVTAQEWHDRDATTAKALERLIFASTERYLAETEERSAVYDRWIAHPDLRGWCFSPPARYFVALFDGAIVYGLSWDLAARAIAVDAAERELLASRLN